MPSAHPCDGKNDQISVFILSENDDIFQEEKGPNGRCQRALASHVVLGGRKNNSSVWPCQSCTELPSQRISEKSKPQSLLNQSSARRCYQNKTGAVASSPEEMHVPHPQWKVKDRGWRVSRLKVTVTCNCPHRCFHWQLQRTGPVMAHKAAGGEVPFCSCGELQNLNSRCKTYC